MFRLLRQTPFVLDKHNGEGGTGGDGGTEGGDGTHKSGGEGNSNSEHNRPTSTLIRDFVRDNPGAQKELDSMFAENSGTTERKLREALKGDLAELAQFRETKTGDTLKTLVDTAKKEGRQEAIIETRDGALANVLKTMGFDPENEDGTPPENPLIPRMVKIAREEFDDSGDLAKPLATLKDLFPTHFEGKTETALPKIGGANAAEHKSAGKEYAWTPENQSNFIQEHGTAAFMERIEEVRAYQAKHYKTGGTMKAAPGLTPVK